MAGKRTKDPAISNQFRTTLKGSPSSTGPAAAVIGPVQGPPLSPLSFLPLHCTGVDLRTPPKNTCVLTSVSDSASRVPRRDDIPSPSHRLLPCTCSSFCNLHNDLGYFLVSCPLPLDLSCKGTWTHSTSTGHRKMMGVGVGWGGGGLRSREAVECLQSLDSRHPHGLSAWPACPPWPVPQQRSPPQPAGWLCPRLQQEGPTHAAGRREETSNFSK